jgi:predicted acylesterase/phospholipase RssA
MLTQQQPFGQIALSLSGGGYRAAGFHLGVLDMLDRLELLKDLSALSTVSGGTFTGMRYALSLKAGEPFRAFFEKFKSDLLSVDIVDLALAKLTKGAPAIPSCRWDVITACAQVYDEKLFAGRRFEVFWEDPPIPLTDLTFNATEFRNAIAFRFQTRQNGLIGNGKVFITPAQAGQIRLADIAAASSCFPGGFEPLNFPDDFAWPDTTEGRATLKELQAKEWAPLPLMDGGVYDNQGMGSLILDDSRREEFGLFIFSDTDPRQDDLYQLPKPRPAGWVRLWHLKVLWWGLLILALSTVVVAVRFLVWPLQSAQDFLLWIPLIMPAFTVLALVWIRQKIASALCRVPKVEGSVWRYVKNLRVNQFIDMMELRISSLFALASSVFMRRIRRLVYASVMNDDRFRKKVMPVLIYNLLESRSRVGPLEWLNPTCAMCDVATQADKIPTTLWFTAPEQLPNLIAAGQITACRKVLLHILSLSGDDPNKIPPQLLPLFEHARSLFEQLRADPYILAGKLTE